MQMQLSFITRLNSFLFIEGTLPIVISGPHAYCDGSKIEKRHHLCDFLVDPILKELDRIGKRRNASFFIIENLISREKIDMNRREARKNDRIDENDELFRQMIRFTLRYISLKFNMKPLLIDLHSYPPEYGDWGDYDLVLLKQTKEGMETDPLILEMFRENLEKEYLVKISDKHNQDDIVEEIKRRRFGEPILIEMNESLNEEKEILAEILYESIRNVFDSLKNDLEVALKRENSLIVQTDSFSSIIIRDYTPKRIMDEIFLLKEHLRFMENKKDGSIDKKISREYLKLLRKIYLHNKRNMNESRIVDERSDALSMDGLFGTISEVSENGELFDEIVFEAIETISNQNKTEIIPFELLFKVIFSIYNFINRENLEEFGLKKTIYEVLLKEQYYHDQFPSCEIPLFDKIHKEFLYKTYRIRENDHEKFVNFIVISKNKAETKRILKEIHALE